MIQGKNDHRPAINPDHNHQINKKNYFQDFWIEFLSSKPFFEFPPSVKTKIKGFVP